MKHQERQARIAKRFKLISIACIAVLGLHYAIDNGIQSIQQTLFVEAGEDLTFEQDDIYYSYFESAKLQRKLKINQEKQHSWSYERYMAFQKRRIQSISLAKSMLYADDGWELKVPEKDFDNLPKVEKDKDGNYKFRDETFNSYVKQVSSQGYTEEYFQDQRCYSSMVDVPGTSLMPVWIMGPSYLIFMGWLFMGIAISADIFMEAIEVITSQTTMVTVLDHHTQSVQQMEVVVWNPTLANLTLMAFGSSAPEIILSVLEAVKDLGKPAGDLGPSTIVGSAAFNLLVISAVSIIAIGDAVKKIDDMGVFFTTAIFSIFAYVWMYYCLSINTPGIVDTMEAYLTFGYFFILLILAFTADKINQKKKKKLEEHEEERDKQIQFKKSQLRFMARAKGEEGVLAAAHGTIRSPMTDKDVDKVQFWYKDILETTDLRSISLETLSALLQPDSLFERFAYRKAHAIGGSTEFLSLKGQKFQVENAPIHPIQDQNQNIGFKCLHYSVTESVGTCKVTIVKKSSDEIKVGVRTIEDTAKNGRDFDNIDQVITMKSNEDEATVDVRIHDDDEWNPDNDFYVELYDVSTKKKLFGDDTQCKVTILDEDFPGKLQFKRTEMMGSRRNKKVEVVIQRVDGNSGHISCNIRTEALITEKQHLKNSENAQPMLDYVPIDRKIEFGPGENMKIIKVELIDLPSGADGQPTEQQSEGVHYAINAESGVDGSEVSMSSSKKKKKKGDDEDDFGPKFKVIIERAEPAGVKLSRKNCCTIEIRSGEIDEVLEEEQNNLINYYVAQNKKTSWKDQFINACMLSPVVDDDDMVVSQPNTQEALMHFATMFWKILFAIIPPVNWGHGWPAFCVALIFIGSVTAVVAEVATVLGCTIGLREAVTAITLVAVGTSLPDTFASMTAAKSSEYADSAIGNVTGSNSVNVFVGLGIPWIISAVYAEQNGNQYITPPGNLAFSVMLFLITSILCFIVLLARRKAFGGELGGPKNSRYASCIFLVTLWLIYVIFSSLRAYEIV